MKASRATMKVLLAGMMTVAVLIPARVWGQRGAAPPQDPNLPEKPVAVAIPSISGEVTGPGPIFDSTPSLPPGKGLDHFAYQAREYFVSGTANKQPYKTRIVVRKPSNGNKFS